VSLNVVFVSDGWCSISLRCICNQSAFSLKTCAILLKNAGCTCCHNYPVRHYRKIWCALTQELCKALFSVCKFACKNGVNLHTENSAVYNDVVQLHIKFCYSFTRNICGNTCTQLFCVISHDFFLPCSGRRRKSIFAD